MKDEWNYKIFTSCLVKVPRQVQVKSKDYKRSGKYPIVSQEAELISGYWDDETFVYKHETPVVIFGDHTKNIKYIDFDFVVGADGTHILSTTNDLNPKFFYYALRSIKLRNLGYARHFKLLKQQQIPVPSLSEQQSIVEYLDSSFAKINAMKANAERALNEAKALFQASLKSLLEPKDGWTEKKIADLFSTIKNGANIRQEKGAKGIPITRIETLSNGVFNQTRVGFANIDEEDEQYSSYFLKDGDILMSHINSMEHVGRSVVYHNQIDGPIIHGMNLLRLIPIENISDYFVYYSKTSRFKNDILSITHKSVNQASFNVTSLKTLSIPIPPLSEQLVIVKELDAISSCVARLQTNYDKISAECDALKQALLKQVFE